MAAILAAVIWWRIDSNGVSFNLLHYAFMTGMMIKINNSIEHEYFGKLIHYNDS